MAFTYAVAGLPTGQPGGAFRYFDITFLNADTAGAWILAGFMKSAGGDTAGTSSAVIGGQAIQAAFAYPQGLGQILPQTAQWVVQVNDGVAYPDGAGGSIAANQGVIAAGGASTAGYTYYNAAGTLITVPTAVYAGSVPLGGAWRFVKASAVNGTGAARVVCMATNQLD